MSLTSDSSHYTHFNRIMNRHALHMTPVNVITNSLPMESLACGWDSPVYAMNESKKAGPLGHVLR